MKTRNILILLSLSLTLLLGGCASVPLAPKEDDLQAKQFKAPEADKSGLYVYRNCFVGAALKKTVYLDKKPLGETAEDIFFYNQITPGVHSLSTESEFSENQISLTTEVGKNYFVEQYIKLGVFVGGANLRIVDEETARKAIKECNLAKGYK